MRQYADTLYEQDDNTYEGARYTFKRAPVRWAAFDKHIGAIVARDQYRTDLAEKLNVQLVHRNGVAT